MKIRTYFRWYDMWIGAYWDRKLHILYVCPLPTWVIEIQLGKFLNEIRWRFAARKGRLLGYLIFPDSLTEEDLLVLYTLWNKQLKHKPQKWSEILVWHYTEKEPVLAEAVKQIKEILQHVKWTKNDR